MPASMNQSRQLVWRPFADEGWANCNSNMRAGESRSKSEPGRVRNVVWGLITGHIGSGHRRCCSR
jgi:hypothetical protein